MIYIGLDVHQRFSRMGCFDPATGEVHDLGSVSNDASALQGALEKLPSPKTVVLEAGRSSYHMAGQLKLAAAEQELLNLTRHDNWKVRAHAMLSLVQVGSPRVREAAVRLLGDTDPVVQAATVGSLWRLGPGGGG